MSWPGLETDLASLPAGAVVADIGIGAGAMLGHLLDRLEAPGSRWRLLAVDADAAAVAAAAVRVSRLGAGLRSRIELVEADVVNLARVKPEVCHVVAASALLSAVPMVRPWGQTAVLGALVALLRPLGRLYVEDYLPLLAASAAGGSGPGGPEQALWRWYKAVAELAGRPHYEEVPPGWVASHLTELGLVDIEIAIDERRPLRGAGVLGALWSDLVQRPPAIGEPLWASLDRYRRDLLREAAAAGDGLPQWSGSYRISGRKS